MTNKRLLFLFTSVVAGITVFLTGCNSQLDEMKGLHQESLDYLAKFNELKSIGFKMDITPSSQTKAEASYSDGQPIQINYPVDSDLIDSENLVSVSSLSDLQNIAYSYAASLQLLDPSDDLNDAQNVVWVSEAKTREAMSSMIMQSKSYLHSLGMTELDIQQMLEEESADETLLVPFTLAMVEHDNSCYYSWMKYHSFSLIPSAFAAVSWDTVAHCALHAIGADIFFGLGTSMCKSWTKLAIKRAFKTAATKMIGPVGAAIVIIDFSLCMNGIEL